MNLNVQNGEQKRREPEYSAQWAMIRYFPTVHESVRYDVHESFAALTVSNFCRWLLRQRPLHKHSIFPYHHRKNKQSQFTNLFYDVGSRHENRNVFQAPPTSDVVGSIQQARELISHHIFFQYENDVKGAPGLVICSGSDEKTIYLIISIFLSIV